MKTVSPDAWAERLSGPPLLDVDGVGRRSGRLRRWSGTAADMSQPPLDHHYVVLHLGGPKRVSRHGEGGATVTDVADRSITLVPAGASFEWRTEGPIDFAHLYIHPSRLDEAASAAFERDRRRVALVDAVGVEDPLISQLVLSMLAACGPPERDRRYLDALFDCVLAALVRRHTCNGPSRPAAQSALAPARLRRVLDYIEASLGEPVGLDDLADAAGLSRYHFSRAFLRSTGRSPLAYLAERRIEAARARLRTTDTPAHVIARETGFASASHFAERFRRHTGLSPSQYRRQS